MCGEHLGYWPFVGSPRFSLGCFQYDPPSLTDPADLPTDAQLGEIAQPNRAKRKQSDHQAITYEPSASKIREMVVCFTAPDQLKAKR